ncbi:MAG: tRNA 2-thiouridine(34) synthase MnmA, partial [Gammaproteobacteria bacterium]|nr:tRNA 2-thiouridine(34) synthase MnmA [Gammaproteobacteria bacterium]
MGGWAGGAAPPVAALLLKECGLAVEGMFMKNWEEDDGAEYCTAQADFEDAARVCDRLRIPLREANFAAEYWDNVFERFLTEYAAGRTPNPDVLCNSEIKFKVFLDYARVLGAERVATGHYVRSRRVNGEFALLKGVDANKDQSYFLQAVPSERLDGCLFPLGGLKKPAVRKVARAAGLPVRVKQDSTGICFIGERRFGDFLARYLPRR